MRVPWKDPALWRETFRKLDPRKQRGNPVLLLTETAAIGSTFSLIHSFSGFSFQVCLWLWLTVLFATFAESLAEIRGKAQASSLKKMRAELKARRLRAEGGEELIASGELQPGDRVVCEAGDWIPGDGQVLEGIASVDESAITGESAPVIRESGGDRSAVTGGTQVLSDRLVIEITRPPGKTFLDQMIQLVEAASRQKTPNERSLSYLLTAFSIFVGIILATLALGLSVLFPEQALPPFSLWLAAFVCLIPTTAGGLLPAVGISGMDRLLQKNVLAKSGRAVEAAGDIDLLMLDKTGTLTFGNRQATQLYPAPGVALSQLAEAAYLSSRADETPEGRSIVKLTQGLCAWESLPTGGTAIPFSANTRESGLDLSLPSGESRHLRKGSSDRLLGSSHSPVAGALKLIVQKLAQQGKTPLVVQENDQLLGVIELQDVLKPGIRAQFDQLRQWGIQTVMVTGDNPLTAASIALEAGVDDFLAQATPEDKLNFLRKRQAEGHLVAMTGDGSNDAPALAQADVGVAMNTGTQAAREAGNLIDLDSSPTKLLEVVALGRQLLLTRGALTTLSFTTDVSKYFALLPSLLGPLGANFLGFASSTQAILCALIFNALTLVGLIPLALRGVKMQPLSPNARLAKHLLWYGGGGMVAPVLGMKLLDGFLRLLPGGGF